MKKFAGALILLIVAALLSRPNPVSSPVDPATSPAKAWVVSTFAGNTRGFRDGADTADSIRSSSSPAAQRALNRMDNCFMLDVATMCMSPQCLPLDQLGPKALRFSQAAPVV